MAYSILYSVPYLALVLFYIALSFIEYKCVLSSKGKFNIRILCVVSCLFFWGFRGFIGWDWTNYYKLFKDTPAVFDDAFGSFFKAAFIEKGYVVYVGVVKQIYNNYHFFIFVSTFVDVYILHLFLKRYSFNYAFGFLAFVIMGGFYMETDLLRNAKSIACFLLSLRFLSERKLLPYILINLIGMQFHLSAILYLPLYFFLHKKLPRFVFLFLFIIGNVIFLLKISYLKSSAIFLASLVGGKFPYLVRLYFESSNASAYGFSIGYIERFLMGMLVVIFYEKIIQLSKYSIIFLNAFILYITLFLFCGEVGVVAGRLAELFIFSYWFLWPAIIVCLNGKIGQPVFVFYLYIYCLLKMYGLTHSVFYSYDNVLMGAQPYSDRYQTFNRYKDVLMSN